MVNFKSFIILIFVCTFFSCNNYNDDSKAPVLHETYLRFVSPKGTNVLDSIKVLEKGKYIEEVNSGAFPSEENCYAISDEIIEKHKNCFINIRTKHLSDDVRELFKDGDLVILQ